MKKLFIFPLGDSADSYFIPSGHPVSLGLTFDLATELTGDVLVMSDADAAALQQWVVEHPDSYYVPSERISDFTLADFERHVNGATD